MMELEPMLALGLPFKAILPEERLLAGGLVFVVVRILETLRPRQLLRLPSSIRPMSRSQPTWLHKRLAFTATKYF